MRTRWSAVAAAVAVGGAAGLAHAASGSSIGLTVSIAGPRAAEVGAVADVRVELANDGADPAQAHVTLSLPLGTALPEPGCSGSPVVECEKTVAGGATIVLAVPVRWDGTGSRTIDVRARAQSGGSSAEASASSSVAVYALTLKAVRTSPARAGKPFVASATLARSDTHEALRARSLRCSAVIAAAPRGSAITTLRGAASMHGSRVGCAWRLPTGTSGRYVRSLVLAATHEGGMVTKQPVVRRIG